MLDLALILPNNTTPFIVSDAGFKVPWYTSVEYGWYWLSRVRGNAKFADLGADSFHYVSEINAIASSKAKMLGGYKKLTKSSSISCQFTLYKSRSEGRKNQRSTRTDCHHYSPKVYSASVKES